MSLTELKEGEIRGENKGIQKGKLEGKLEVAINLLKNNITVEQVVKFTGLSIDLVEELAKNLGNNQN